MVRLSCDSRTFQTACSSACGLLFKAVRYSAVGVFAAGILTAIQGCTLEEATKALLILLALGLGGGTTEETTTDGGGGVAFDKLYWTDFGTNKIQTCPIATCANATVSDVVTAGLDILQFITTVP